MRIERLPFEIYLVVRMHAEDRAGNVAERHEIAARTDRAELEDVRRRPRIQEFDEALEDLEANAGDAAHQRIRAQQHCRPHISGGEALARGALVLPDRVL